MQQSSFRRRSFYEKPIAHILFWILIIGSAVLAWWVLDQAIATSQVAGAVLVVSAVIWLGLRKAP